MMIFPSSARSLLLLCVCCGGWAFGFGLDLPLASRWLQDAGRSESFIGYSTGAHFLGVVLMGVFAPAVIRRNGRGCILAGLLLSGVGVAAFPWGGGPIGWFTLRILAGSGGALTMVALETLINLNAPPERRARDFAFYACSVGIGFALGTFTGFQIFAFAPKLSFVLGGGITLAVIPLLPLLPKFPFQPLGTKPKQPIRAPFLAMGSAWSQGFLEAGMFALMPLYLKAVGMSNAKCGSLFGGILIGVLVCQLPIGWLADRIGRERVLIGCFAIVGIALAAAPNSDPFIGMPIWLFVIGVCSGAFYPLGLALVGERLPPSEIPRANAWFLGINSFGSLISFINGPSMEHFGDKAIFWTGEAVVVGVLLMWLISRSSRERPGIG